MKLPDRIRDVAGPEPADAGIEAVAATRFPAYSVADLLANRIPKGFAVADVTVRDTLSETTIDVELQRFATMGEADDRQKISNRDLGARRRGGASRPGRAPAGEAVTVEIDRLRWKAGPSGQRIREWTLRERPGRAHSPVGTRATAAVVSFGDGLVRWSVTFHRYVPRKPLEMRTRRNETTGADVDVPPPPIIPERVVSGRIAIEDGKLEAVMLEAQALCEQTVTAGRPTS